MKQKTKFIFLSMQIRNGEYEHSSESVHEIPACKTIRKFGQEYAKDFYGTPPKAFQYNDKIDPDDWWYFNGGEIAARVRRIEEITKEEYDVLKRFI
jgi:hypothetical protein